MNGSTWTPHLGRLQHLDLGLLRVLCALVRLRSVSRAAAQLCLSQPAISHALARLRSLTGDALLVRQGRTMVPTSFAVTLAAEVEPALLQIEASLLGRTPAQPTSEIETVFRLGMSDDLQIAVLPTVLSALRSQAPKARLVVTTHHQSSAPSDLRDGKLDLVLAYLEQLPPQAKVKRVADLDYRVLRADVAERASAMPIDLATYCARPHLLVTFAADLHGFVDDALSQIGARRHVACSTAQFGVLPFLLAGTDLLATVPAHLARALSRHTGLRVDPLPFACPRFPLSLCWSATVDQDPAQLWLRRLVEDACAQVLAVRRPMAQPRPAHSSQGCRGRGHRARTARASSQMGGCVPEQLQNRDRLQVDLPAREPMPASVPCRLSACAQNADLRACFRRSAGMHSA